jgi:phosphoribosylaminoimidazole (AIR) synthetase
MVDGLLTDEEIFRLTMSDTSDPEVRQKMLAYRVAVLTREKEQLEVRVAKMERTFTMGAGVLMVLPILGTAFGLILAYGQKIFKPWTG